MYRKIMGFLEAWKESEHRKPLILHRFPSAIKIDTFARGRVELLKFKVLPEFELDGMSVSQISNKPFVIFA